MLQGTDKQEIGSRQGYRNLIENKEKRFCNLPNCFRIDWKLWRAGLRWEINGLRITSTCQWIELLSIPDLPLSRRNTFPERFIQANELAKIFLHFLINQARSKTSDQLVVFSVSYFPLPHSLKLPQSKFIHLIFMSFDPKNAATSFKPGKLNAQSFSLQLATWSKKSPNARSFVKTFEFAF